MRSGVAYSVFPSKIDFVDDEHGQIGAAVMNRITSSNHISGPSSGVSAYCFFWGGTIILFPPLYELSGQAQPIASTHDVPPIVNKHARLMKH